MDEGDEMGKKMVFAIKYDGTSEAIKNHSMEARELATTLMAMDNLFRNANEIINGKEIKISVNVRGDFKAGSFEVRLEVLLSLEEFNRSFPINKLFYGKRAFRVLISSRYCL